MKYEIERVDEKMIKKGLIWGCQNASRQPIIHRTRVDDLVQIHLDNLLNENSGFWDFCH